MICLMQAMKLTRLSLRTPELQINDFLNRTVEEFDPSELEPSGAPNQ